MNKCIKICRENWFVFGLVLLIFLVFWPVKNFEFINYDDPAYVTEVPQIRAGLSPAGLKWAFFNSGAFGGGLPLTSLSYLLDSQLFGIAPSAFHLTNLLLHIANALLVFFLFRRMTGTIWHSLFVAGLFALHPLCVEPVAWISSRKDLLCGFFSLLSIWAYVRYVQFDDARFNAGKKICYGLALLFFAMGLMSKAAMVTLPFCLLLLDFWPLKRFELSTFNSQRSIFVRLILEKLPFLTLTIFGTLMAYWNLNQGGALASVENLPLKIRVGNGLVSYLLYIGKMFWPRNLAVIYPYPDPWMVWQVIGATLILCAISFFAFKYARRHPCFITGWFWFLGTLLPVIGLIQIGPHSMADRYAYLPMLGLFIIFIWGIDELAQPRSAAIFFVKIGGSTLLLICAVLSHGQLQHWRNSESLLRHAVKVTEKNYLAYNNLGAALEESGKLDEAKVNYAKALEIKPDHTEAHYNLGLFWMKKGDLTQARQSLERVLSLAPRHAPANYNLANVLDEQGKFDEAQTYYLEALKIRPAYAEAHNNLAILLSKLGQRDASLVHFQDALKCDPDYLDALNNLGITLLEQGRPRDAIPHLERAAKLNPASAAPHYNLGNAHRSLGQWREAVAEFAAAVNLDPQMPMAHYQMGTIFSEINKPDDAFAHFLRAVELNPGFAEAHYQLALILSGAKNFEPAIAHYKQALRVKPDWLEPLNNLAWILATNPNEKFRDGKLAMELSKRAAVLTENKNPGVLDTLAAAYAEAGEFAKAADLANKTADLAAASNQNEMAGQIHARLELYRAGKPFRQ